MSSHHEGRACSDIGSSAGGEGLCWTGTLHWGTTEFVAAEVRVYDKLFSVEIPGKTGGLGAAGSGAAAAATAAAGAAGAGAGAAAAVVVEGGEEDQEEEEGGAVDWLSQLNPDSLVIHSGALLEPSIAECAGTALSAHFQLQRLGYFTVDKVGPCRST